MGPEEGSRDPWVTLQPCWALGRQGRSCHVLEVFGAGCEPLGGAPGQHEQQRTEHFTCPTGTPASSCERPNSGRLVAVSGNRGPCDGAALPAPLAGWALFILFASSSLKAHPPGLGIQVLLGICRDTAGVQAADRKVGGTGAPGLLAFNTHTHTLSPGGDGHSHRWGHVFTDGHTDMPTPTSLPWSLETLGARAPAGITLGHLQSPSIGTTFLRQDPHNPGLAGASSCPGTPEGCRSSDVRPPQGGA